MIERPRHLQLPAVTVALDGGHSRRGERSVAVETAINVVYGGVPFAVMMTTPADFEDFAYGFSLTEGVIERADQVRSVAIEEGEEGLRLLVEIAPDRLHNHLARRRAMSGRTGCGVCGIDDLAALNRAGGSGGAGASPVIALEAVAAALAALPERQELNVATGAVHAASFVDLAGRILLIREDVGRHNALDKLIGAALRANVDPLSGFVLMTSRCSFELVEKTAVFGARALVTISGPTSLAIERARRLDIALGALARGGTLTVFHAPDRIGVGRPAKVGETVPSI
jgi:FdhD protein